MPAKQICGETTRTRERHWQWGFRLSRRTHQGHNCVNSDYPGRRTSSRSHWRRASRDVELEWWASLTRHEGRGKSDCRRRRSRSVTGGHPCMSSVTWLRSEHVDRRLWELSWLILWRVPASFALCFLSQWLTGSSRKIGPRHRQLQKYLSQVDLCPSNLQAAEREPTSWNSALSGLSSWISISRIVKVVHSRYA